VTAPRFWLAVGPAVLLWGLYTGNTAHAQATAGWQPTVAAALVAAATFIAALIVERPRLWGSPWISAAALAASGVAFGYGEVTVDGVHGVAPWWTVVAQVVGALALAGCLGFAAERQASRDRGLRRGLLLATGFLLFVVFVFAYYAAYDLFLPNDYVPFVVAAVVGLVGAVGRTVLRPVRRQWWPALAGAVAAVLAVVAVPVWRPAPAVATGNGDGLRVAAYNIRMGFGLAGTFTVPEQADILRGLNADVIVLSEVDRAWFLNGGHDDLGLIASRLGMQFVWAPAADEVWGDALLTRLPITRVRNHVLVQGGPTGAQALEVGLRWQEREITVIATHLQPPSGWRELDQVEQLAAIVRAAAKPTIVAGDLNLQPGDRAWSVLIAAGLTDPLASVRPFVTIPTPGDAEQIDHILVTPGFTGADQANPDLPASDHRPIAVTLAAA
jgi:endonuclease/exonuclease/phosphatase family metal-dependent hydrolase